MMRRIMVWLLFFLAWGVCFYQGCGISAYSDQALFYYGEGKGPDVKQIMAMEDGESDRVFPDLSLWNLEKNVEVTNKELGKTKKTDCMTLYGNREMAMFYGLDSGTYGFESDSRGCLVSRGLALELFGSVSVAGQAVWCRGERYEIRGVTSNPGFLIQVPSKPENVGNFPFLLMSGSFDKQKLYQYGIGQDYICVDIPVYQSVAGIFLCLPLWTMLGCRVYIFCRKRRGEWKCIAAAFLFFFAIAGSFIVLSRIGMGISAELIPDRWSDFDFWAKAYREVALEFKQAGEVINVPLVESVRQRLKSCVMISAMLSAGTAAAVLSFASGTGVVKDRHALGEI